MSYLLVFVIAWGCARVYYAMTPDHWGSWEWSLNSWYIRYHTVVCKLCPRKHYCEAWAKRKDMYE